MKGQFEMWSLILHCTESVTIQKRKQEARARWEISKDEERKVRDAQLPLPIRISPGQQHVTTPSLPTSFLYKAN